VPDLIRLVEAYGLLAVFLGVWVKELGLPLPAGPLLLLVGAHAAQDAFFGWRALGAAALASMCGDMLWFLAGRRYGRTILGLLCRVSISPATCIRKTELSFTRGGVPTVLFAKFIPGVSRLAIPLAGAVGMRLGTFLMADLAGAILWAGTWMVAGLVFRDQLQRLAGKLVELGGTALLVVIAALALYVLWRILRRYAVNRRLRAVVRLTVQELAQMMAGGERLLVVDVRAADLAPLPRIPGAVPAPSKDEELALVAADARVVTYCDCPNDASAAKAALRLSALGYDVQVLAGGFPAWAAAGLPVDATPGPRWKGGKELQ